MKRAVKQQEQQTNIQTNTLTIKQNPTNLCRHAGDRHWMARRQRRDISEKDLRDGAVNTTGKDERETGEQRWRYDKGH